MTEEEEEEEDNEGQAFVSRLFFMFEAFSDLSVIKKFYVQKAFVKRFNSMRFKQ